MSAAPAVHDLDPGLAAWLDEAAEDLDVGSTRSAALLPALTGAGLARIGVPEAMGGAGGDVTDAVAAIAAVSERSLAAGFVLWGHRTYIEFLLQSPNARLRERLLPSLLDGTTAGASALSNAMKFLSGLEELQVTARRDGAGLVVDGKLPWVTNLRVGGFHVAAAVSDAETGDAFVVSLADDDPGVERSPDLELMGMRGTSTAAVRIAGAAIPEDRVIAPDAAHWLPAVRPAFLGLQCGMSIGLARRALAEAAAVTGGGRHVLREPAAEVGRALDEQVRLLDRGLKEGAFQANAAPLFRIRIALAGIAAEAVSLELQASGGRAYLAGPGRAFARRWREVAFIPLITPSLVQLETALAGRQRQAA